MTAINFAYKADLTYSEVIDNTIILKKKEDNEVICKFPIPKKFQISAILNGHESENIDTYIITPYKLNKPKFMPRGYGNLSVGLDGLWHMDRGKMTEDGSREEIVYIDTTILSEEDFEYSTIGKFKIREDEIPSPFWVRKFCGGWKKTSDIQKDVKEFDKKARLIYEEELISIFALNDVGFEFYEHLSDDMYEYFRGNLKYFCIGANELCLDNWEMVVASRENRNLYRLLYREKSRMFYEQYWYRNRGFMHGEEKKQAFHIFPVLDGRNKGEIEFKQQTSVSKKDNEIVINELEEKDNDFCI